MEWMMIAVGGGMGAALRYIAQQVMIHLGKASHWATAFVNLAGSFLIGAASAKGIESGSLHFLFVIGMLGAFTTFSTFAFDIVKLIDKKQWWIAFFYITLNLVGGISAFWLGWIL
ncbi:CrcB family protein [Lysinibacillus yapensis]|uniref:Fluoride-specific ion channel FluC n=1 Tax=Ureibacillus yapensis TaxID=2304605 RepID=A0A396SQI2_9BACL|nr:CrcB family protein [Lysinibacillus yapensis]RHW38419.1 CrcB family protein [Lysinibacillus yapensis]